MVVFLRLVSVNLESLKNLQLLDFADELEESHEAQQPQEGDIHAGQRDPADEHQPEVEVVPGALGAQPVRGQRKKCKQNL